MASDIRVGIDLGGTKIEGIALDSTGATRLRRRVATPRGDYAATVEAVAGLVASFEQELGSPVTVGVGMPGAISPASGLVKNANSTWLNGRPLGQDLSTRLGREVRCANDANCFALSEATDGAAAGAGCVFGVILGTGVGGGIVVGGAALTGPSAIAGEWGHNAMPWPDTGPPGLPAESEWPGPPCYCGRTGCIETFLSGPALSAQYQEASGTWVAPSGIAAQAAHGHADAERCLRRYETRLARALASVINILDPDVIVLGGGVSNIDRLYSSVPAEWGQWVFSDVVATRLVKAIHGDSSGVRGAAWLWPSPRR